MDISEMEVVKRTQIRDLNPHLVCSLCCGYMVEASTITECLHSFCKSCIYKYLESSKYCPICDVQIHKTKPHINIRPDKTLQTLIYKLVPGLLKNEMQRRQEFFENNSHLDPSSLSIILPNEHHHIEDRYKLIRPLINRQDWLSFSIKYLKSPKDSLDNDENFKKLSSCRFLRCPGEVPIRLVTKLVRKKFELTDDYLVELYHNGCLLKESMSISAAMQHFNWDKSHPFPMEYTIKIPRELLSNQSTLSHPCDVVGIKDPPPKDGDDDDGLVDGDINGGGVYSVVKSASSHKTDDGENNNKNNNENNDDNNNKEENRKNSDKNYKEKSAFKNNLMFNNNKIRLVVKGLNNDVRMKAQTSLVDKKEFIDEGGGVKKHKLLLNDRTKNNDGLLIKNTEKYNVTTNSNNINLHNNNMNLNNYTATTSDNMKIRLKRRSIIEDDDQHHKRFRPVYSIMPYKQDTPLTASPSTFNGSVGALSGGHVDSVHPNVVATSSSSSLSLLSTSTLDTTTDTLNNSTSTSIAYTSLGTTSTPHPPTNSTPYHSTPKSTLITSNLVTPISALQPCDRLSISAILSKTTPTQTGVNKYNNVHQKANVDSPLKHKSPSFSSLKMITNNLNHILKDNKKVLQQKRSINQPIKSNERNIFDLVKPMLNTDLHINNVTTTTSATFTSKKYDTTTTTTTTSASGSLQAQLKDADINNNNMQQPNNYQLNNIKSCNSNNIPNTTESNFTTNDNTATFSDNKTSTATLSANKSNITTLDDNTGNNDEQQTEVKCNHDESLIDVETYDDDDDDSGVCFAAHSLTETSAYNYSHNDSGLAKESTLATTFTSITTTKSSTISTALSDFSKTTTTTTNIQLPTTTKILSFLNTTPTTVVASTTTTTTTTTHSSTTPLNIPQYSPKPLQVMAGRVPQRKNNSIDNITTNLLNSVANKINNSLNNLNNNKIISLKNLNNNKVISLNNLNNNKVIPLNNLNKFNYSEPLNLIKVNKSSTSDNFVATTISAVATSLTASSTTSTVTTLVTATTSSNILNVATTTVNTIKQQQNPPCYHHTGIFLNKIASDFRHLPQNLSHKAIQDKNVKSNTKIIRVDNNTTNINTTTTVVNNVETTPPTTINITNNNNNDSNNGVKLLNNCSLTCSLDTDHRIKLKLTRKHPEIKSNPPSHEDVAGFNSAVDSDVVLKGQKCMLDVEDEDDKNINNKDINNNYVPNLNNKEQVESLALSTPSSSLYLPPSSSSSFFFPSSSSSSSSSSFSSSSFSSLYLPSSSSSSSLNSRYYKISKREMSGLYMDMSQKYLQEFPSNGFAFDSTLNQHPRGTKRPLKNKTDAV